MGIEMAFDMMNDYPPSLAGIKKMREVPDGFCFYAFAWLGDNPEDFDVMRLTGAVYREAKSGPNKGKRTIQVPNSVRNIYVTAQEIKDAAARSNAELKGSRRLSD